MSEGPVVALAALVEVLGQVLVGVAVAVRPNPPDLLGAQPVTQSAEHAQLVDRPVDPNGPIPIKPIPVTAFTLALEDEFVPPSRYHSSHRDIIVAFVEAFGASGVGFQETQGADNGPVGGVVGAELQRAEHGGDHRPIVTDVGRAHLELYLFLVGGAGSLGLLDHLRESILAHHGEDHLPYRAVGI